MKIKLFAIIGYLVLSTFAVTAQDKISLLEIDKVNQLLELSTDQFKIVKIDIDKIKSILESDLKMMMNPVFLKKLELKEDVIKESIKLKISLKK